MYVYIYIYIYIYIHTYINETIKKHSKYKYTYYQNTHTIVKTHGDSLRGGGQNLVRVCIGNKGGKNFISTCVQLSMVTKMKLFQSPDLNPLEFSFLDLDMKKEVNKTQVDTRDELLVRILDAAASI